MLPPTRVFLPGHTDRTWADTLFPASSLRYVPDPLPPAGIDDPVFGGGEALEFTTATMGQPHVVSRSGTSARTDAVRAEALIRAARNFTKQKEPVKPLTTWSNVEQLGAVPVNGEPCNLVASRSRGCHSSANPPGKPKRGSS